MDAFILSGRLANEEEAAGRVVMLLYVFLLLRASIGEPGHTHTRTGKGSVVKLSSCSTAGDAQTTDDLVDG